MKEQYNHKYQVRVRTWEVDGQGIVHNSNYIRYFEVGRIEYMRNIGYEFKDDGGDLIKNNLKVVVVHNSLDYKSFARFDELLDIYTRISWIKESSLCFEHIIENNFNREIICTGKGILVNINKNTGKSESVPEILLNTILNFEKHVEILRK